MRTCYLILLFFMAFGHLGLSQNNSQPDTLINEPVIGDPISLMLNIPSGDDQDWVNYDQDMAEGLCVNGEETPLGWFVELDFGVLNPNSGTNEAFTSCSYLVGGGRNHNWLILPPIFIPDDSYKLCWRSLSFEGPRFLDGYKVLASTASNLPSSGDYNTTLFTAAEMIGPVVPNVYTLDPADYIFSDGYIHANGYTDTSYFFHPPGSSLRGRLEPHCISLAQFSGESIYIAFHHDSRDDSMLQLDDILVSNDSSLNVATRQPSNFQDINIIPNPVTSSTYVHWRLHKPEAGQLLLRNATGKLVLKQTFSANAEGQIFLDLTAFPSGVYHCTLQTVSGQATRKLVKI